MADPDVTEQLATRAALADALHRYCRGIDRLDPELVASAFHPGAQLVDYGPEPMSIETFVEHALGSLGSRFVATQHKVTNVFPELDGDHATQEAYVLAYHLERADGAETLHTFCGRYVDRFERRDGEWRISRRHLRVDWTERAPVPDTMGARWVASGRAGTPDPIFDRS